MLDALARSPACAGGRVVVLTSDHGESLGEHDYYFDHGEDLFDPSLAIPLIVRVPGRARGTRAPRAGQHARPRARPSSTRVKVSYPPDLAGTQPAARASTGGAAPARDRLFAQNDRNLTATFDARYKLVATPRDEARRGWPSTTAWRIPGRRGTSRARSPRRCASRAASWSCSWSARDREWARTRRAACEGRRRASCR